MLSLLTILFAIFIFLIIGSIWWYATIPPNLPPGPLGLPFLGSMLNTFRATKSLKHLRRLRKKYGPIYSFYVADRLVVVLDDFDIIQEALVKNGQAYAGRPGLNGISEEDLPQNSGLLFSEGDLWKIQRRFALSTLRDFGFGRPILEPSIKEETDYLVRAIQDLNGQSFDPSILLNNSVSNVICAMVFGHRFEYNEEKFHELLRLIRSRTTEGNVSALNPILLSRKVGAVMTYSPKLQQVYAQARQLIRFVQSEIDQTLSNFDPSRDEATNYIQAFHKARLEVNENSWTFTDEQLIASVFNLFAAGTDTTSTTLRWAIFYLSHHPEWQEKIYKEIQSNFADRSMISFSDRSKLPLVEAAIMETQRLGNLVPLGGVRRTLEPTKLLGYDIPEGTVVVPLLTTVLRDPKVYPEPEKFDPSRFLVAQNDREKSAVFTHLTPFSAGKRICLGESLARMELFLFFIALVSNFKFSFPSDEPIPDQYSEQMSILRAPPQFNIRAERRMD